MLFISTHEQLRLRYGAWTRPTRSLRKKKKSLSFKTSSSFQGLFFLPEKYILCRLKAPTKVCSGESFETRCALPKSHFPLAGALRFSEQQPHTPSFSQSVRERERKKRKERSWRDFGAFFDNPRCCDANSRRSQRQSEVQSAVQ